MNTAEILLKAADVIETRGWWKNDYLPGGWDVDERTCPSRRDELHVQLAPRRARSRALDRGEPTLVGAEDPVEDFSTAGDCQDAAIALADYLGLGDRLAEHEVDGIETVVGNHWNDVVATSTGQVITALRECAAEQAGRTS